ncbi:hypothetical protein HK101_010996 [Irineochytrium annulatum]|nr:hypothetical protein HK101_010996 [Irineochytrium annulatum]
MSSLKRRLLIPTPETVAGLQNRNDVVRVRSRRLRPAVGVQVRRRLRRKPTDDIVAPAAEGPWGPAGCSRVASYGLLLMIAVAMVLMPDSFETLPQKQRRMRNQTSAIILDLLPPAFLDRALVFPRTDARYVIDDPAVSPFLSLAFPSGVIKIEELRRAASVDRAEIEDDERQEMYAVGDALQNVRKGIHWDAENLSEPRYLFCSIASAVEGCERLHRAITARAPSLSGRGSLLNMQSWVERMLSGRLNSVVIEWLDLLSAGTESSRNINMTVGGFTDALHAEVLEVELGRQEREMFGRMLASGGSGWLMAVADLFERRRYLEVSRHPCENVAEVKRVGERFASALGL